MKKRTTGTFLCLALSVSMMMGCGNAAIDSSEVALTTPTPVIVEEPASEPEPTAAAEPTEEATPTPTPTPDPYALPEGQMYSYLTGEAVETSYGTQRPFAVMINNIQDALPQSGISGADIIYEVMVEGSITRLMAVFQDPSPYEKIGPVRSARHYFIDFAFDNEAIYTHFGWSPQAQTRIEHDSSIEDINGMFYDGDGRFYRTSDRVAPHNAYASGSGLLNIAAELGFDRSYPTGYQPNLLFSREDTTIDGEDAKTIYVPFNYDHPYFVYNEEDGLYYRYQYYSSHIDVETGEQLAFKNVIITDEEQWLMDEKHLDMNLWDNASGNGWFFTNGKVIPITWSKQHAEDNTWYYDLDGNRIQLNPGKTMFEIIPNNVSAAWSAEVDEYGSGWNAPAGGSTSGEHTTDASASEQYTEEEVESLEF